MPEQEEQVSQAGFLAGKKVVLFPNDSYPKVGVVKWVSPDGRALMLELTGETHEASGYRPGDSLYVSGAFLLKILDKAKPSGNGDTIVT